LRSYTGVSAQAGISVRVDELRHIAAGLVFEHGDEAGNYARRVIADYESRGVHERAQFWQLLCVLLDDIAANRLDPDATITIH
jgi:hypothetical protein